MTPVRAVPLALIVAALLSGCGMMGGNEAAPSADARPIVAVRVDGNNCAANWNGEAVTPEALGQRAATFAQRAGASVSEIYPVIESARETPFICAGYAIAGFSQAGITRIALRLPGADAPPAQTAHLFAAADRQIYRPQAMLELGADNQARLNNQVADAAAVREYLTVLSRNQLRPQDVILSIASDNYQFGAVYDALRLIRDSGVETMIGLQGVNPDGTPIDNGAAPAADQTR